MARWAPGFPDGKVGYRVPRRQGWLQGSQMARWATGFPDGKVGSRVESCGLENFNKIMWYLYCYPGGLLNAVDADDVVVEVVG